MITGVLGRWWLVLLLTLLGGLGGWIFHLFQPPVYEATAGLNISMLFEQRVLTQYEQDYAFDSAGVVINSSEVIDAVLLRLQNEGLSAAELDQLRRNMSTDAMLSTWNLHARDRDPQVAVEAANAWAADAEQALNAALGHALRVEQLETQISSLQSCLPSTSANETPPPADCSTYSLDSLDSQIQTWSAELVNEQSLSRGILPIMTFSLANTAPPPGQPALYGLGASILAGACIGLILSLWLVNLPKVRRRV